MSRHKITRLGLAYGATAALVLAVVFGMLKPSQEIQGVQQFDKLFHIGAFALLVVPLGLTRQVSLLALFVAAVGFGGVMELIQPFFGRSRDIADLAADALGAGAALLLIYLVTNPAPGQNR